LLRWLTSIAVEPLIAGPFSGSICSMYYRTDYRRYSARRAPGKYSVGNIYGPIDGLRSSSANFALNAPASAR
jgi:hypothetical protein